LACLLAIAELAGGIWHDRARAAAVALSTDADAEDTIGVELLCDLRGVFDALGADRLLSSTIVAKLAEMEGRPWAEFGRSSKPLTTHQLARLLKPFKVSPGSVRPDVPGDGTKGYKRESLVDLWDRYFQVGTSAQPKETATSSDIQTGTPNPMCQSGIGGNSRKLPLVPLCRILTRALEKEAMRMTRRRTPEPMMPIVRALKAQGFRIRRAFPNTTTCRDRWDFVLSSAGQTLVPLNRQAGEAIRNLAPPARAG
jgi:hypothetical protein